MKVLLQYKKFAAFVLILLQVFISTPVQLYHHHNRTNFTVDLNHQHTIVTEVCPICNHQYTAYYDDDVFGEIFISQPQYKTDYAGFKFRINAFFYPDSSNKSPPLCS